MAAAVTEASGSQNFSTVSGEDMMLLKVFLHYWLVFLLLTRQNPYWVSLPAE